MKKGYLGLVLLCSMSSMGFAADNVSKQIQMLNSQIQTQLQQIQEAQQKQIKAMNTQLQTQMKQMQVTLQAQIQTLNTQTQAQMKTLQTGLNTLQAHAVKTS